MKIPKKCTFFSVKILHCEEIFGRTEVISQPTFTCSSSAIKTLEKDVKYVQS